MISSVRNILKIPELRKKIGLTFAMLIVYRIGFFITLPGVDQAKLDEILNTLGGGGVIDLLNFAGAITGGNLGQCVLFGLGIMPYISASIIFSLLVKVIPSLEALQQDSSGRQKIQQWTRYATVGLCLFQAIVILSWMRSSGIIPSENWGIGVALQVILGLTTGGLFLMWLGEQITEFGIGNGISLLIMAGIIARMPGAFGRFYSDILLAAQEQGVAATTQQAFKLLALVVLFILIVAAVVVMQQSQRRIPIQHAKHTRGRRVYGGQRHYFPIRVNMAGVMPVIFAQSLLILPAVVFNFFSFTRPLASALQSNSGFLFMVMTCGLVFFFTYFWISLMHNPVQLANNMKEYGSFIPGIRPGRRTSEYLEGVLNRITFVGAAFLAAITIFPNIVSFFLDIDVYLSSFLGGTGILIIVGVALDIVQKVESHLLMRRYEGFMKKGRGKGRL